MMPTNNELDPVTGLTQKNTDPEVKVDPPKKISGWEHLPEIKVPEGDRNLPTPSFISSSDVQNPFDFDRDLYLSDGLSTELEQRAQDQTWYELAGKGLANTVTGAVGKFVSGIGHLGGLVAWGFGTRFDRESIGLMTDNFLVEAGLGIEEATKADIYRTRAADGEHLMDKLLDGTWWATTGADGAAFMLSAFGPGMISKFAKPVASILGPSRMGGGLAQPLVKLAGGNKWIASGLNGAYKYGDDFVASVSSTVMESGTEAAGVQQRIEQELRARRDQAIENLEYGIGTAEDEQYANLTDEDIAYRAGGGAAETFTKNFVALLGPNIISQKLLFGNKPFFFERTSILNDVARATRNKMLGKLDEAASIQQVYKASYLKAGLKAAGFEALTEGPWEENVQLSIENRAVDRAIDLSKKQTAWEMMKIFQNPDLITNFSTIEGQESIFLGSFLGGLMGGSFGAANAGAKEKAFKEYSDFFDAFTAGVHSVFNQNGLTFDIDNQVIKNEAGEVVRNVSEYIKNGIIFTESLNAQEQMVIAAALGDHQKTQHAFENYMGSFMAAIAPNEDAREALNDMLTDEKVLEHLTTNILPTVLGKGKLSKEESHKYISELVNGFMDSYESITNLVNPLFWNNKNVLDEGKGFASDTFRSALNEAVFAFTMEDYKLKQARKKADAITQNLYKKRAPIVGLQGIKEKLDAATKDYEFWRGVNYTPDNVGKVTVEGNMHLNRMLELQKQYEEASNKISAVDKAEINELERQLEVETERLEKAEELFKKEFNVKNSPYEAVLETAAKKLKEKVKKLAKEQAGRKYLFDMNADGDVVFDKDLIASLEEIHKELYGYIPEDERGDSKSFLEKFVKDPGGKLEELYGKIEHEPNTLTIKEDVGIEKRILKLAKFKQKAAEAINKAAAEAKKLQDEEKAKEAEKKAVEDQAKKGATNNPQSKTEDKKGSAPSPASNSEKIQKASNKKPEDGGGNSASTLQPVSMDAITEAQRAVLMKLAEATRAALKVANAGKMNNIMAFNRIKSAYTTRAENPEDDDVVNLPLPENEILALVNGLNLGSVETLAEQLALIEGVINNAETKQSAPPAEKPTPNTVVEDEPILQTADPAEFGKDGELKHLSETIRTHQEGNGKEASPNTIASSDPVLFYNRMMFDAPVEADTAAKVSHLESRIGGIGGGFWYKQAFSSVKFDDANATAKDAATFFVTFMEGTDAEKAALKKKYPVGYMLAENNVKLHDYISDPNVKAEDLVFTAVPETNQAILSRLSREREKEKKITNSVLDIPIRLVLTLPNGDTVFAYLRDREGVVDLLRVREIAVDNPGTKIRAIQKGSGFTLITRSEQINLLDSFPGGKFVAVVNPLTGATTSDNVRIPQDSPIKKGTVLYIHEGNTLPVIFNTIERMPGLSTALAQILVNKTVGAGLEYYSKLPDANEKVVAFIKELLANFGQSEDISSMRFLNSIFHKQRLSIKSGESTKIGKIDVSWAKDESDFQRYVDQVEYAFSKTYLNGDIDKLSKTKYGEILSNYGMVYTDVTTVAVGNTLQHKRQPYIELDYTDVVPPLPAPAARVETDSEEATTEQPSSEQPTVDSKNHFDGLGKEADEEITYEDRTKEVEKEIRKVKELLPQERVRLSEDILRVRGKLAYGVATEAGITIWKNAKEGTAFHEAFHIVSQYYLKKAERDQVYADARKVLGEGLTTRQVEEALADDFADYMRTGKSRFFTKSAPIRNWFIRLLNYIKSWFSKGDSIRDLYRRIENGDFRNTPRLEQKIRGTNLIEELQGLAREADQLSASEIKEFNSIMLVYLGMEPVLEAALGAEYQKISEAMTYSGPQSLFKVVDKKTGETALAKVLKYATEYEKNRNQSPFWQLKYPAFKQELFDAFTEFLSVEFNVSEEEDNAEDATSNDTVPDKNSFEEHMIVKAAKVIEWKLATLPWIDQDTSGFKTSGGNVITVKGALTGSIQAAPLGLNWNILITHFAGYVAPSGRDQFDAFMDHLELLASKNPGMARFKAWLLKATEKDQFIKDRFIGAVFNSKLDFMIPILSENDTQDAYQFTMRNSNSVGVVRGTVTRWSRNFAERFYILSDDITEKGDDVVKSVKLSKEMVDKAQKAVVSLNKYQEVIAAIKGGLSKPKIQEAIQKLRASGEFYSGVTESNFLDYFLIEAAQTFGEFGIDINVPALKSYLEEKKEPNKGAQASAIIGHIKGLWQEHNSDKTFGIMDLAKIRKEEDLLNKIRDKKGGFMTPISTQKGDTFDALAKHMLPYAKEVVSPMVLNPKGKKQYVHSLPSHATIKFDRLTTDWNYFKSVIKRAGNQYLPALRYLLRSDINERDYYKSNDEFFYELTDEFLERNKPNWEKNRQGLKAAILMGMAVAGEDGKILGDLKRPEGMTARVLAIMEMLNGTTPVVIAKENADKQTQLVIMSSMLRGFDFFGKIENINFDKNGLTRFLSKEEVRAAIVRMYKGVPLPEDALVFEIKASRMLLGFLMGRIERIQKTQFFMDKYNELYAEYLAEKNPEAKEALQQRVIEFESNFSANEHFMLSKDPIPVAVRNADGSLNFNARGVSWSHMTLFEGIKTSLIEAGYGVADSNHGIKFHYKNAEGKPIFHLRNKEGKHITEDNMVTAFLASVISKGGAIEDDYMKEYGMNLGKSIVPKSLSKAIALPDEVKKADPVTRNSFIIDRFISRVSFLTQAMTIETANMLLHGGGVAYGLKKNQITDEMEPYFHQIKRDAATLATVLKPSDRGIEGVQNTITVVNISDPKTISTRISDALKALKKEEVVRVGWSSAEEAADMLVGFNQYDAIAYITDDFWRVLMIRLDKWSNTHEEAWNKRDPKTGAYSDQDARNFMHSQQRMFMSSLKGVQYGERVVSVDGIEMDVHSYDKESEFILTAELANSHPEIGKIYNWMKKNGVDKITNGMKAGIVVPTELFTPNIIEHKGKKYVGNGGSINENAVAYKRVSPIGDFGLQQETPNKAELKTIVPTQMEKNLRMNLAVDHKGDPITKEYTVDGKTYTNHNILDLWASLDEEWLNLRWEAFDERTGEVKSKKHYDYLLDSFVQKNASEDIIRALKKGTDTALFISEVDRLVKITLAGIRKTTQRKQEGLAGYQVPVFGFTMTKSQDTNINGTVFLKDEEELQPELLTSKDGKLIMKPAGVLVPMRRFKALFDYHGFDPSQHTAKQVRAFLDEHVSAEDRQKILSGLGARIPNQDMASNDYLEIVGLLPESAGDVIVAYTELPGIKGSDFDIDKMYMLMYNTYIDATGKLRVHKYYDTAKEAWNDYLAETKALEKIINQYHETRDENTLTILNLFDDLEEETDDAARRKPFSQMSHEERLDYLETKLGKRIRTLKDFEEKKAGKFNSIKAIENRRFAVWEAIISHPDNYKALVSPIDSSERSSHAYDMLKSVFDKETAPDMNIYAYSNAYQEEQRISQHMAKGMVGGIANVLTSKQALQINQVSIPYVGIGESYEVEVLNTVTGETEKTTWSNLGAYKVQDFKHWKTGETVSGVLVTKFMGHTVNMVVDASKDNWGILINHNNFTFSVSNMLQQLGVDYFYIDALVFQPVLRLAYKNSEIYDNMLSFTEEDDYGHFNNGGEATRTQIVEAVFGLNREEGESLYNYKNRVKKAFEEKVPDLMLSQISYEQLKAALKDDIFNPDVPLEKKILQASIYKAFEKLQASAKIANALAKIKPDTDSAGGSRAGMLVTQFKLLALLEQEKLGNLRGFSKMTETGSLSHFINTAIKKGNDKFKGLSFAETPAGRATLYGVLEHVYGINLNNVLETSDSTLEGYIEDIMSEFNSYVYSSLIVGAEKSYTVDDIDLTEEQKSEEYLRKQRLTKEDFLNKLLFSNKDVASIAMRYAKMKIRSADPNNDSPVEEGIRQFTQSPLFSLLETDLKPGKPLFLTVNNFRMPIGMDISDIKRQWLDFATREDTADVNYSEVRKFLHDLAIYSYFLSGFKFGSKTMHTYIPMEVLTEKRSLNGFNLEEQIPGLYSLLEEETADFNFIDSYRRHRTMNSRVVPRVSPKAAGFKNKVIGVSDFVTTAKKYSKFKDFAVWSPAKKDLVYYRLASAVTNGDVTTLTFKPSHKQGYYDSGLSIKEYKFGSNEFTTMFRQNQPGNQKYWESEEYLADQKFIYGYVAPEIKTIELGTEIGKNDSKLVIYQNFADGSLYKDGDTWKTRNTLPHLKGKTSIEMILSGHRTRTTRSKSQIEYFLKTLNLKKPSDLVGQRVTMVDENTNATAHAIITGVFDFTQKYQDATWEKEGWEKEVTDRLVGEYPYAIEFEVVSSAPAAPVKELLPIRFEESKTSGYADRTIKNASADATIALAVDFSSAGERLTKKAVLGQNKKYIPIDATTLEVSSERVDKIVSMLNSVEAKTLNIAGNGIYTMKGVYTQEQVDMFTYELLKAVLESPNLLIKIESIRSGGQTGFDEAGAKAGVKLGIPTTILAPKYWKFRQANGEDVSNEAAFKNRFNMFTPTPVKEETSSFPEFDYDYTWNDVADAEEDVMPPPAPPALPSLEKQYEYGNSFNTGDNNRKLGDLTLGRIKGMMDPKKSPFDTEKYGVSGAIGKIGDVLMQNMANSFNANDDGDLDIDNAVEEAFVSENNKLFGKQVMNKEQIKELAGYISYTLNKAIARHGVVKKLYPAFVITDEAAGISGEIDLLVEFNDGKLIIVDLKTGKEDIEGWNKQMSAYYLMMANKGFPVEGAILLHTPVKVSVGTAESVGGTFLGFDGVREPISSVGVDSEHYEFVISKSIDIYKDVNGDLLKTEDVWKYERKYTKEEQEFIKSRGIGKNPQEDIDHQLRCRRI